jgi:hypothetical protein
MWFFSKIDLGALILTFFAGQKYVLQFFQLSFLILNLIQLRTIMYAMITCTLNIPHLRQQTSFQHAEKICVSGGKNSDYLSTP